MKLVAVGGSACFILPNVQPATFFKKPGLAILDEASCMHILC